MCVNNNIHPFLVGIDLGTTNSAVSFADLRKTADGSGRKKNPPIEIFTIPQLTAPGEFNRLPVLPSFLYLPGDYEVDPKLLAHPWPASEDHFVGAMARDQGAKVPGRLVSSAKSWLCHANVDRNRPILPWGAPEEVHKVSPVQASAAYLAHIKRAWNHVHGDEEELFLENQTVILTVPASFDEVARELTLSAAKLAGYKHVTLIEEPLAAFYSWLIGHESTWEKYVQPGELILICDVGGGTTDFTLITLRAVEGGSPRFERIAVGDHLILGGDNIDLALARSIETQLTGRQTSLSTDRWKSLCHECRKAKERILSQEAEAHRITLMGAGSRLISGTVSAELNRATVEQIILEGFFPLIDDIGGGRPIQRQAITEFGLPYEPEPAITRHICRFLSRHQRDVARSVSKTLPLPDLILFNGGMLKPKIIQDQIIRAIAHFFHQEGAEAPRVLHNPDLDQAVSLGAAYYGLVKIGRGVRVGSGSPRSFYLGLGRKALESHKAGVAAQAICLVERGLDEGSTIQLSDKQFEVLANQPVRFDLFSSSYRGEDRSGAIVTIDDTFSPLPPLQTVIRYGKKGAKTSIPVQIEAEYTEMGTLALYCRSLTSGHRWQLQFQLRDVGEAPEEVQEQTVLEAGSVRQAGEVLQAAFEGNHTPRLDGLVKEIAFLVDLARDEWPLGFIRELADILLQDPKVRSRSAVHEARWMNLFGFCMRPGFGDALDAERISASWKVYLEGPAFGGNPQVQAEWWIMWRRLAGGLVPGQQRQLMLKAEPLLNPKKGKKVRLPLQRQLELWMLIANLERLYVKDKIQWGRLLLSKMQPSQVRHQHFWALARIGARELLYGPADRVIPAAEVTNWINDLLSREWRQVTPAGNILVQLARKTGDRTRDLGQQVIERLLDWLSQQTGMAEQKRYLQEVIPIARQEERTLYGESLPAGLVLREY